MLKSKNVLGLLPLLILSFYTYVLFTSYAPKVLAEVREVKGAKTGSFILPYPKDAVKIASNKTFNIEQTTLQVNQPIEKVQEFYKNILFLDDWEIEKITKNDPTFITTIFKKKKRKISINTSKQGEDNPNSTIVSIEILSN